MKIKVYFFAGIAGGTGSGTIVDLAIMTRHIIESNYAFSKIKGDVELFGNIFMPSACGIETQQAAVTHGDRNAYAALKEIDYFSSLENMNESYKIRYGTEDVVTKKNLFDFCTLIEGNSSETFAKDPATMAQNVAVQSILNTIIRNDYTAAGGVFLVDSLRSNMVDIKTKVLEQPQNLFPRNANYIYSVAGFSQCVVPTDLICSYIMRCIYDSIYKKFTDGVNFRNLPDEAKSGSFEKFIFETRLDKKSIDNTGNYENIKQNIDAVVGRWLGEYGPFYLINFTLEFAEYLRVNYIEPAKTKGNKKIGGEKYQGRAKKWAYAANVISDYNNGLFEIYTTVIEELKKILEKNAEILTKTERYEEIFGSRSFTWSPIQLTDKAANNPIFIYIQSILNTNNMVNNTIKAFCDQLWGYKEKWERLLDAKTEIKFDAANDIRNFLEGHIRKIIKDSGEDLIVKVYSGDPAATAKNNPVALTKAAETIYSEFEKRSCPMAQTSSSYESINLLRFMAVPEDWENLYTELENYNKKKNKVFQMYKSTADDRIVSMQFNNGVAAYMLNWTKYAEETYEKGNWDIGLHMSQSPTGKNWIEQPNLYVEDLWEKDEWDSTRKREADIIRKLNGVLEHARYDLGIFKVIDNNSGGNPFHIYLPTSGTTAQNLYDCLGIGGSDNLYELKKGEESLAGTVEIFNYDNNGNCVQKLENEGYIEEISIEYGSMPMGLLNDNESNNVFLENRWILTKQIIRRIMNLKERIEKAVALYDELADMIKLHNDEVINNRRKRARMDGFVKFLRQGNLRIDELYNWILTLYKFPETIVLDMSDYKNVAKECREYFLYKDWYLMLSDEEVETYESRMVTKNNFDDDDAWKEYQRQWKMWQESVLKPDIMNWYEARQVTDAIKYPMQTIAFEKAVGQLGRADVTADEIRAFYKAIVEEYL